MLIKALLIALLFYFILRVSVNLLRAVQTDGGRQRRPVEPPRQEKERATRYEPEMDIEDAKWEDL